MKIASYNSHRSAPFLRALVAKNNQVYSLEGSRRRYPISVPAGILRARNSTGLKILVGADQTAAAGLCRPSVMLPVARFAVAGCLRGRQRYLRIPSLADYFGI